MRMKKKRQPISSIISLSLSTVYKTWRLLCKTAHQKPYAAIKMRAHGTMDILEPPWAYAIWLGLTRMWILWFLSFSFFVWCRWHHNNKPYLLCDFSFSTNPGWSYNVCVSTSERVSKWAMHWRLIYCHFFFILVALSISTRFMCTKCVTSGRGFMSIRIPDAILFNKFSASQHKMVAIIKQIRKHIR